MFFPEITKKKAKNMIEISNNVRIYASEKTFSRLLIPFPRIGLKEKMGVSWSAESIADHSALFNKSPRYKNLRNCQDYEEACINVKQDGYATSPTYTSTLINPIKKFRLWMWDYEVLKHYTPDKLRTVRKGSDGGGVYLLQQLLIREGFPIQADGNFGPATESAVISYQTAHNLEADGIVGPKTWREIKK